MSAASDYCVALVERVILPAIDRGRGFEPPTPGDLIAYALHWADAIDGFDAEEEYASGWRHFEAEAGEGDDIAQGSEDFYRNLIEELP